MAYLRQSPCQPSPNDPDALRNAQAWYGWSVASGQNSASRGYRKYAWAELPFDPACAENREQVADFERNLRH